MNNLLIAREKNNMTQQQVGNHLGVKAATVSRYESAEIQSSPKVLKKLSTLYHCSVDYLLGIENSNSFENVFSASEIELLLRYRTLNDNQKDMLSDLISIWEQRNNNS